MLKGIELKNVVKLLNTRQVDLYHACQFEDFLTYVRIGGIPSRAHMEANSCAFTTFDTDGTDHDNDVWDKVFVNMTDFGATFARGQRAVPNPYGPILLHVQPAALLTASDVAICLRSAGAEGFDREVESLSTSDEIDRLFANPADEGYPASTWIKFASKLREDFNEPDAHDPEISCSINQGFIPMDYVTRLTVDPYVIRGRPLVGYVRDVWPYHNIPVNERRAQVGAQWYAELEQLVRSDTPSLDDNEDWNVSKELRNWAQAVARQKLQYQFNRYANYLREGTINAVGRS